MRWITWVLLFFMKAVDVNISLCRLEPGCKQGKQGKNSQFFFKWCLRGSSAQTSCFLQVISILTWSPSYIALRIHDKYNFNFFCFELMPLKVTIKKNSNWIFAESVAATNMITWFFCFSNSHSLKVSIKAIKPMWSSGYLNL